MKMCSWWTPAEEMRDTLPCTRETNKEAALPIIAIALAPSTRRAIGMVAGARPHLVTAVVVVRSRAGEETAVVAGLIVSRVRRVPEESPAAVALVVVVGGGGFRRLARQHDAASLGRDAYLGDGRLPHGEEQRDEAHQHQLCTYVRTHATNQTVLLLFRREKLILLAS